MRPTDSVSSDHSEENLHCPSNKGSEEELPDPALCSMQGSADIDHLIVKVVSEHNIEAILKQKAIITLECLVRYYLLKERLRKYQLIERMEPNPEGGYLIVLNPKVEGRTLITGW